MSVQLSMVKEELIKNPSFSGEPPAFHQWAMDHVLDLAISDPSIKRQIDARISFLQDKRERLELERQNQLAALDARAQELNTELQELLPLIPVTPCQ